MNEVSSTPALNPVEQRWQKRLERERLARKQAETLLEDKSLALYKANLELRELADSLEKKVTLRTEELSKALQTAEAATRAKSDFLATMSHEIRTPMNGVIGMTDLLSHTALNEEQQHYLSVLKSCGHSLLGLINDILDYSKIEAGKLELEMISVNPRQLLEELKFVFHAQAEAKGIRLILEIAPEVPLWIETDPTRLRQIFFNLIANAIKFTEQGEIQLSLKTTNQSNQLRGEVRDSGIGIEPQVQQQLFTPFKQADSSITRQYGGTGLGLAICARLSEALGGEIGLHSEVGQGSEFYFTFHAPTAIAQDTHSTPHNHPLLTEHLNVLLVEDNPINQMLALKLLEKLGIQADLSRDGLEAIEAMQQHHYDIVLMDMQMPKMDGLSATRYIRALGHLHQPRIIALTANAFAEDQQACKSAGMNGFLTKPITLDALSQAILSPDQAW